MVKPNETTFYLIRHGEAEINVRPERWEISACGLTERGRRQIAGLANRLRTIPLGVIYSSTMHRARESAAILAEAVHAPIMPADWLREMNYGDFERLSLDEVRRLFPEALDGGLHAWDRGFPSGETFRSFHDRVVGGLDAILNGPPLPRHVALIGHGGSIQFALSHLLGLPPIPVDRFVIDNASLSIVRRRHVHGAIVPTLVLHNDTSHWLPPAG